MMKKRLALLKVMVLAVLLVLLFVSPGKTAGTIREYNLTVTETKIEYAPGKFITAWTYNNNIPGPLIRAYVGDIVKVTLKNNTKLKHSIHVHGFKYTIENDGAQMSPGSMVPPGGTFTYTFEATRAGFFPYHCHSDDGYPISVHIQQGLQGGILIEDPTKLLPAAKEYVTILNEAYGRLQQSIAHYCSYCAGAAKYFTINHRQYPMPQALNVATGAIENPTARVGERVRFYVLQLGNDLHSFHIHGHPLYRRNVATLAEEVVDADVKGLFPGEGVVLETVALNPGNWMFHCHMDVHADLGMIGIFTATP